MQGQHGLRGGSSQSIAQLMDSMVTEKFSDISSNQQALKAWYMVGGERERIHTVGVFLKEPDQGHKDDFPKLFIYVDSTSCVIDFNAGREVYCARLEALGLKLSALIFKLSRYAQEHKEKIQTQAQKEEPELPPLTPEEEQYVKELVRQAPEHLQKSVSKAMISSMRRQKTLTP